MSQSNAIPSAGETGDRYVLQDEIARGDTGAVLRGRDVDLGRDLALKVLLEKHGDNPEVARRFIEEAQITAQLQHPGVVPVYDIGRFGDLPYFTMKLVKGLTLAAILGERTDPAADRPRFLAIALQVAQTLAYAHAKGVIHRDLEPAKVMIGAFGEVQILDWGLAKVLRGDGSTAESRSNQKAKSKVDEYDFSFRAPAYAPPEQARGGLDVLDRRADVFRLGAMLCEILTGKPPYRGRSVDEVRRKAANGDLADASARLDVCGADPALIALTKKCLASEVVDRPEDAQRFAEELADHLHCAQERLHQAELARAEARGKVASGARHRALALVAVVLAFVLGFWLGGVK